MNLIERWLYNTPEAPVRRREKPMKVLALGMSRSGTVSLQRALEILGYDHVYHGFDVVEGSPKTLRPWTLLGRQKYGKGSLSGESSLGREDFDALLGHTEAIADQPCALFPFEMIKAYPEAKVILNHRNVDGWYESYRKMFPPIPDRFWRYFHADMYWIGRYNRDLLDPFFYGSFRHHGKWVYEEHSARIRGLVPSDRLLEWKVQDGWGPLCRSLGKPIPSEAFPSGNVPLETIQRARDAYSEGSYLAKRNFGILCACIFAILSDGGCSDLCQPKREDSSLRILNGVEAM